MPGTAASAMPPARSATSLRWMLSSEPAPTRITLLGEPEAESTRFMPSLIATAAITSSTTSALPPIVWSRRAFERNRFRTA